MLPGRNPYMEVAALHESGPGTLSSSTDKLDECPFGGADSGGGRDEGDRGPAHARREGSPSLQLWASGAVPSRRLDPSERRRRGHRPRRRVVGPTLSGQQPWRVACERCLVIPHRDSRWCLYILDRRVAGDDGDGNWYRSAGEGGDKGTGSRRLRRRPEHQHRDILILVYLLEDHLSLLALADHVLGGDALKAPVVKFAAQQAEHRSRFNGLLFELRLAHALPKLTFRFEHGHTRKLLVIVDETPEVYCALHAPACVLHAPGGVEQRAIYLRGLVNDYQELAGMTVLECASLLRHIMLHRATPVATSWSESWIFQVRPSRPRVPGNLLPLLHP